MIINSTIWKKNLFKEIEEITKYFQEIDFSEDEDLEDENDGIYNQAFIKLQKFAIYSSIVVRKLIEANKISDELMAESFGVLKFNKTSSLKVTVLNGYELEELYDMDKPIKISINLKRLTDDIIHSFHFMPKYDWQKIDENLNDSEVENWKNNGLIGFYLSTDKSKEKYIQLIQFEKFTQIIQKVIEDYVIFAKFENGEIVKKNKYTNTSS